MRIIERLGFTVYCPTTVENFVAGSTEINGSVLFDKRNEFGKRIEDPIASDGAISRRSLDDKFKRSTNICFATG